MTWNRKQIAAAGIPQSPMRRLLDLLAADYDDAWTAVRVALFEAARPSLEAAESVLRPMRSSIPGMAFVIRCGQGWRTAHLGGAR